MLLGISTTLSHTGAKDWAEQHKKLGCKAVVFPLDCNSKRQDILDYAEAAKDAGLVIAEVGIWKNVIAVDQDQRKHALEYAIGQLKLADEIGARCCVNIAGATAGERWDGACRENFEPHAWEQTVESIQHIIDTAKPIHTKYAVEPMPWMIPTGPEEYLQLLNDINRTEVGVHMDIVNMINCPERFFLQEEFMRRCFEKLKGRICSCHLKDIRLREEYTLQLEETACGKGSLNIELYTSLASQEKADMPMIIEHLHSDQEYRDSFGYIQERLKK